MSINMNKLIERHLGPTLHSHGFRLDYDQSRIRDGLLIYAFGDPAPNGPFGVGIPQREEIRIDRNRWSPAIGVLLRSWPKRDTAELGVLAGANSEHWWPIATPEQADNSLGEILALLNAHAWNWFQLGR